ncbi:MAG: pyruvate formate lyase family protein [Armatimonadota bacterium]|nr:pyruvate formate lyase family protein [Armatimonadota bacterium]
MAVTTDRTTDALPQPVGPSGLSDWSRALREDVLADANSFDERDIIMAESFRETEGEPRRQVRVAKAVARLFQQMPVRIREGEVLAGWHPNTHPDEEMAETLQEAREYLGRQHWRGFVSEGHMAPDYPTVCQQGLDGLLRRIDDALRALVPGDPQTPEKQDFYEAARIALTGLQTLIERYADLAEQMAGEAEDERWAEELREIAGVCRRVAHEPPRSFREAIQLGWFMFLGCALENSTHHHCFGPGRLDQWLWRFWEAERQAGTLDEELAEDLLAQLLIKCNEFQGPSMSAVILVIGGRRPDGSDATNELSWRILELADRVQMYFPGIDISWHADIDEAFMRRAISLLRNGRGQPSLFNSDVIVRGLVRRGVPFEHAVDHLPSTCTETSIMGRSNPHVAWPYVNVAMCLLYALFGGVHPEKGHARDFAADVGLRLSDPPQSWTARGAGIPACGRSLPANDRAGTETGPSKRPGNGVPQTYAELRAAFMAVLGHAVHGAVIQCNRDLHLQAQHRPFPLLSCFIEGCIETGRNISHGGALYNFIQPEAVGVSNVVDALAAIRTLVAQRGEATLEDFRAAIREDFEGHEDLRRAIQRECPKHGNDEPLVNELFGEVAGGWCDLIEGHTNLLGGPFLPGFLGWTVWIRYGEMTPATPDGRRAGEPLANSIMSCTGVKLKGFPSLVRSITERFDHSRALGGTTCNVRFQANVLDEDHGVDALKGLSEAALDLGAYQLQFNLASTEAMRAAQESPDEYRDLLVRIGGYLVPFVLLPPKAQEEVIAREELGW